MQRSSALAAMATAVVVLAGVAVGPSALGGGAPAPRAPVPVYGTLAAVACYTDQELEVDGCDTVPAIRNDAYSVLSPDAHHLYVSSRDDNTVTVFRRDASSGKLGRSGCVADTNASGAPSDCVRVAGFSVPTAMVVSPDGRFVYVSAYTSSTLWVFARSASTGNLTPAGCYATLATNGCTVVDMLRAPLGLAFSPDGAFLYVDAVDSDAVTVMRRDAGTGLLAYASCAGPVASGCVDVPVLRGPRWTAVSADGRFLYVASSGTNALVAFARDGVSGAIAPIGCWSGTSTGVGHDARCSAAVAVGYPQFLTISPDGRQVYTSAGSSVEDGGIAILQRDVTTGLLAQGTPETSCVADFESLIDDCTRTVGLGAPLGIAFDPTGTNVYVGAYEPGTIGAYRRDPVTGSLTRLGSCFSADTSVAEGCESRDAMSRAGFTLMSPDGRYLYVQAPSSGAIQVFGRRAVPPEVLLKTATVELRHHKKFRMALRCPHQATLGCFGLLRVRVLGESGKPAGQGVKKTYDVRGGTRFKLRLAFDKPSLRALGQTRHDVAQVDLVSGEPGGDTVTTTLWLRVRTGRGA